MSWYLFQKEVFSSLSCTYTVGSYDGKKAHEYMSWFLIMFLRGCCDRLGDEGGFRGEDTN